jgi:hypothetical protein
MTLYNFHLFFYVFYAYPAACILLNLALFILLKSELGSFIIDVWYQLETESKLVTRIVRTWYVLLLIHIYNAIWMAALLLHLLIKYTIF